MTNQDTDRSSTGVPGLDEILRGGYIPARIYLVDGNPGAGKTTLALQYLLEGVRRGERCLYVTLSETRDELTAGRRVARLVARRHRGRRADRRRAPIARRATQITMYHPSEVELTETTRKVLRRVERVKPQRMVFDSLSELRLLAQSSLRYRRQILALKQFFIGRSCTVLLLDDRTAEGPDLQLQSIAHGVLSLRHSARLRRALRQLRGGEVPRQRLHQRLHDFAIRRGGLAGVSAPGRVRARAPTFEREHGHQRRAPTRRAARRRHRPRHHHAADRPARHRQVDHRAAVRRGGRAARRSCRGVRVRGVAGHPARARAAVSACRCAEGTRPGRDRWCASIDPAEVSPGEFAAPGARVGGA